MKEFSELREAVREKLTEMRVAGVDPFFVAINEAVNNAIFHGNKQDETKKVQLTITNWPGEVRVIIRDEGQGFATAEAKQEEGLQESGRGIEIIRHCVDQYYFSSEPSEMVLIKKVASSPMRPESEIIEKGRLANAN
ncbi:ATP-binding protein [Sporomusa sp. KB1]|uniref:ATP-binding protein n=1 Tax=Sporomusa sp. KB1 TaxID=943346 RepID=UPI001C959A5A|nr:ATP-binding protein [Sporomusa sp. KB1]